MEGSCSGVKFQPRDRRSEPLHRSGNDRPGDAIQSVTDDRIRLRGVTGELPHHLRDLVDQTSGDLDRDQRRRLAEVLLEYADIFPVPGDPLTGHTNAVEHDINAGDRSPIRCAHVACHPRR